MQTFDDDDEDYDVRHMGVRHMGNRKQMLVNCHTMFASCMNKHLSGRTYAGKLNSAGSYEADKFNSTNADVMMFNMFADEINPENYNGRKCITIYFRLIDNASVSLSIEKISVVNGEHVASEILQQVISVADFNSEFFRSYIPKLCDRVHQYIH